LAQTLGAKIVAIARREASSPPGTAFLNHIGGKGYCKSRYGNGGKPEYWCADFVKWVWRKAGALNTSSLNAAAASFAHYGPLRPRNPRVGDAVVFGYQPDNNLAAHVAIVVEVHPDGKITTIGGDEGGSGEGEVAFASSSAVCEDGPYSVFGSQNPGLAPITGYVSPLEDDMPYTEKRIVQLVKRAVRQEMKKDTATRRAIKDLVKQGVAAELKVPIGPPPGVTPAQGAQAAVEVKDALAGLKTQVDHLTDLVTALSAATPAPTVTQTPTGTPTATGGKTPTRTRTPAGATTPTRTRRRAGTGMAPADGRG
jgi:hypothetical protein